MLALSSESSDFNRLSAIVDIVYALGEEISRMSCQSSFECANSVWLCLPVNRFALEVLTVKYIV